MKALWARSGIVAQAGNRRQRGRVNDERVGGVDEASLLCERGNPWKANPGRGCGVK